MVRTISETSPEVVRDGMVELIVDSIEEELLFSVGHEMMKGERRGRGRGRSRGGREEWGNRCEHIRSGDTNSCRSSDALKSWDQ
jgi:hypothetical protein